MSLSYRISCAVRITSALASSKFRYFGLWHKGGLARAREQIARIGALTQEAFSQLEEAIETMHAQAQPPQPHCPRYRQKLDEPYSISPVPAPG